MQKFGKINIFGDLEIATKIIQTDEKIIVNPTEEEYLENEYKKILEENYPKEKEGFNIVKKFTENCQEIIIKYEYEEIIEENTEHFEKEFDNIG